MEHEVTGIALGAALVTEADEPTFAKGGGLPVPSLPFSPDSADTSIKRRGSGMAVTHIFGGTMCPSWAMPKMYRFIADRVSEPLGGTEFHSMPECLGLGRTDKVVDHFRPILEEARSHHVTVRLAGHSLGGVVAWVLAQDYPDVVEYAELWGAPIHGTVMAAPWMKFPEAQYLRKHSSWLKQYDKPAEVSVRSVYTMLDALVVPPREASYAEGERVNNHYLAPVVLKKWPQEHLHWGIADHCLLPRLAALQRLLGERFGISPATGV